LALPPTFSVLTSVDSKGCGWRMLSSSTYHHHVDVEPQLRLSFLPF
jgi:hypothetical protein